MQWTDLLGAILSGVATVTGGLTAIGVAALVFDAWKARREEKIRLKNAHAANEENDKRRNFENYKSIDEKYFEYLKLLAQYPELQLSLFIPPAKNLTMVEEARRQTVVEMLFGVMETAYIGRAVTEEHSIRRWPAWEQYIDAQLQRSDVRMVWFRWKANEVKPGFTAMDLDFERYVDSVISRLVSRNLLPAGAVEAEKAEAQRTMLKLSTISNVQPIRPLPGGNESAHSPVGQPDRNA
jgi:hypothetical protein